MKTNEIKERLYCSFGNRLQEILYKKGFASKRRPFFVDVPKFSKITNISQTMIRRYLSGIALPSDETIINIAKVLDVDPYFLFCGYDESEKKYLNEELSKKILIKMKPLIQNCNEDEYIEYIDSFCEIYSNLIVIDQSNEIESKKIIDWMLSEIINKKKITTSESFLLAD